MKELIKKIYRLIPFKKNIFSLIKRIYSPPEKIFKHLHFRGIYNVRVDKKSSFRINHYGFQIENEIFWKGLTGGWEKISMRLWIELCRRSTTILDIGANTGVYALAAKSIKPDAKVYAFEPVKRVKEKLDANIRLNNYDIVAIEAALSNYNGQATIYDQPGEHTLSVTVNKNMANDGAEIIEVEIPTLTLSSFIEKYALSSLDLMKIDVETHEPEVLEGMGEYLSLFRPTMLIEILNDEVAAGIEDIVGGLDYLYYNIDEQTTPRLVENLQKSDYFNFLICSRETAAFLKLPVLKSR